MSNDSYAEDHIAVEIAETESAAENRLTLEPTEAESAADVCVTVCGSLRSQLF